MGIAVAGRTAPAARRASIQHLSPREVHRLRLHWTLAVGSAGALAALLVHGLVDAALWGNKAAALPWLLIALVCLLFLAQQQAPYPNYAQGVRPSRMPPGEDLPPS